MDGEVLNRCGVQRRQGVITSGWFQGVLSLFTHIDLLVTIVQMNVWGGKLKAIGFDAKHGVWLLSRVKQMLVLPINHLCGEWKTSLQTNPVNNEGMFGDSITCSSTFKDFWEAARCVYASPSSSGWF